MLFVFARPAAGRLPPATLCHVPFRIPLLKQFHVPVEGDSSTFKPMYVWRLEFVGGGGDVRTGI